MTDQEQDTQADYELDRQAELESIADYWPSQEEIDT